MVCATSMATIYTLKHGEHITNYERGRHTKFCVSVVQQDQEFNSHQASIQSAQSYVHIRLPLQLV